jgi:VWFA-related protein
MVVGYIPQQARIEFLDFLGGLKADDHIGIYTFWNGYLNVLHEYTADARDLLARLASVDRREAFAKGVPFDRLFPRQDKRGTALIRPHEGVSMIEDSYLIMFRGLKAISNAVAAIPGRKNLIWLGPGFSTNFAKLADGGTKGPALVGEPNRVEYELQEALNAANQAHVAIYGVDPRGLMTGDVFNNATSRVTPNSVLASLSASVRYAEVNAPLEGLSEMADQTGGRVFANRNDILGALREAVDDARVSYVLGYYPPEEDWDGRLHKVEVKVKRFGVSLVYRRGYIARAEEAGERLGDAASGPYDSTALPFRVQVRATTGDHYALTVRIARDHLRLIQRDGRWQGALDFLFIQRDEVGNEYEHQTYTAEIDLKPETYQRIVQDGEASYTNTVVRHPHANDLRVIVRNRGTDLAGSVTVPFADIKQPPQ